MKVTIKDVAKEAKVATSTVSRVLSNSGKISDETKRRVREAIEKLNYTPSAIARGLASNKTKILAVLVPEGAEDIFENPFFIQAMKGISISAEEENYYIMYAFKDKEANNEEWIRRFTDSNLVDGICLVRSSEYDYCIKYLKDIKFPFVVIGRPEIIEDVLWVDNDNFKATYDLVITLLDKGHEDIAFIGCNEKLNVSIDRFNGYKEALSSRGLRVKDELILHTREFNEKEGYEACKVILQKCNPSAIIATDDLLAIGVQEASRELNRDDITIVGFNNIPLMEHRTPPLSSVDINSEKLGYYATRLLINKLENKDNKKKYYIIDTKLVDRGIK